MLAIIEGIKNLFTKYSNVPVETVEKLPESGSDRTYFRIFTRGVQTHIATYNQNQKETVTFVKFSNHFRKYCLPVPEIFAVNEDETIYIQEDFGDTSLLNQLE